VIVLVISVLPLRKDIATGKLPWSSFPVGVGRSERGSRGFPPKKTTPRDPDHAQQLRNCCKTTLAAKV
jgi:hypothetical protein